MELVIAVKVAILRPARGIKIKVNYFYRTVRQDMSMAGDGARQDTFFKLTHFSTKNATFYDLDCL